MVRLALSLLLCLFPSIVFAGLETVRFGLDGFGRNFVLYVPDSIGETTQNVPLILVLHGGGGSARQIMRSTNASFNQLADEHGFVVAYPDAIDGIWDFGEGAVSQQLNVRRDDMKYFDAVVQVITSRLPVDPNRIFATGISRGGQASYALACKRPGQFRAVAPVAMPLPDFLQDDCKTVSNTGIFVLNGTKDPIVPYTGGPITLGRKDRGRVLSTSDTMAIFARGNGCSSNPRETLMGAVQRFDWRECHDATVLAKINDGGHTWPSARGSLPKRLVGETNRDIEASTEIWQFFSQFR